MKKIFFTLIGATCAMLMASAQQGVTQYGTNALQNNGSSGIYNSAFGYYSLSTNTTGVKNTAIGANVLRASNGNFNTGVGYASLYTNTSGFNNAALGLYSLFANTTGYYNTALGTYALQANTTAYYNTAVGYQALFSNTNQSYNTAIGSNSLYMNTGGVANTAVGYSTLFANTSGLSNTCVGHAALYLNTTGNNNNAMGRYALYNNRIGSSNNAFGYQALYNDSIGSNNTASGDNTLFTNTTGSYNTALGSNADVTSSGLTNATAIGFSAKVNASNKVVVGNTSVSVIGGTVNWSVLSDGRFKKDIQQNVPGLAFINKLNPVTYHINQEKLERFLGAGDSAVATMKNDFAASDKKLRTGFIAQEVEKTSKEINYDFDGVNAPQSEKDNYSIAYADFVPSLVKAIQELSKQNDSLKNEMNQLKTMLTSGNQQSAIGSEKIRFSPSELSSLLQNTPNPFSQATTISYYIPSGFRSAQLMVTDVSGAVLKTYSIAQSGSGKQTISGGELASGMYQYSLLIDGKLIDTKKMLLVK